jgi:hypothetical protein
MSELSRLKEETGKSYLRSTHTNNAGVYRLKAWKSEIKLTFKKSLGQRRTEKKAKWDHKQI